jgi:hypothetical protein
MDKKISFFFKIANSLNQKERKKERKKENKTERQTR